MQIVCRVCSIPSAKLPCFSSKGVVALHNPSQKLILISNQKFWMVESERKSQNYHFCPFTLVKKQLISIFMLFCIYVQLLIRIYRNFAVRKRISPNLTLSDKHKAAGLWCHTSVPQSRSKINEQNYEMIINQCVVRVVTS